MRRFRQSLRKRLSRSPPRAPSPLASASPSDTKELSDDAATSAAKIAVDPLSTPSTILTRVVKSNSTVPREPRRGQDGSTPPPADVEPQRSERAPPPTTEPELPAVPPPNSPTPAASASKLAVPNRSSHTSSNLPKRHQNLEYTEVERDGSSSSEVTAQEGSGSATVFVAESLEQPAHCEDGSRASTADLNMSRNGEPRSLWNQAYDNLEKDLVEKYNKLLSRELTSSSTSTSTAQDQDYDSLDETVNQISTDPIVRRTQLDEIMERGKKRMENSRSKYTIAGHDFDLKKQLTEAADFVLWGKAFVDQAVKPSAEASLIWAGVGLILPLLTYPHLAAQANESGFNYITTRMDFYVALEPQLLPASISEELKKAFQKDVVDLYQHILEFQFRSVLRFYKNSLKRFARDVRNQKVWDEMLSKVQAAEQTLKDHFEEINIGASTQRLENLDKRAEESLGIMKKLLLVTEQQRDISSNILQQVTLTNELHGEIPLPTDPDALYDSADVSKHLRSCEKDTRKSILKEINEWANAVESESIFWLHGPAGLGKSTMAWTVACDLAKPRGPANSSQLGASYFFKRPGRSGSARFFPTIASRLMASCPEFKNFLIKSLKEMGDVKTEAKKIDGKALGKQFETLIQKPLKMMNERMLSEQCSDRWTRVIVIDGLDECEDDEDIRTICTRLTQLRELRQVRLRVFLTCRDDLPIRNVFENPEYRNLSLLDDRFSDETKKDIGIVLRETFNTIKKDWEIPEEPWPDPKDLGSLLTFATDPKPLFIYVTTLGRFVADESENPKDQLKLWLEQDTIWFEQDPDGSQLVRTYTPILTRLLFVRNAGETPKPISNKAKEKLRRILGTIVLLATPLSAPTLANLLDMDLVDINRWLQKLRAVLNVPKVPSKSEVPLEVVHKSFRDFLLGQAGTGSDSFRVDAAETHAMLTSKCINRMKRTNGGLRKDMCNLQDYGKPRDKIDETTIREVIPPDLKYATLNWVYHLQHCRQDITNENKIEHHISDEDIYDFFREHFLHWLEALSLIGAMSESDALISTLQSLIVSTRSTDLSEFLYDAKWFILRNRGIVDTAPFQLYSSAILFAPETSITRNMFKDQIPKWICRVPKMPSTWSPELWRLEGHDRSVRAVAFSPDGKLLASASSDMTVRLWNPATGKEVQKLEGHDYSVGTVAFSPGGKLLASASADRTVRLWNLATGKEVQKLEGHGYSVRAVAFSPDGKLLASVLSDSTVRLWNPVTGKEVQKLEGHDDSVGAVVFSPDGKLLASASNDWTVRLWNPATEKEVQKLEGHDNWVRAVAFSPDGKLLASASDDRTVRLWNPVIGKKAQKLKGHNDSVGAVVFSPDGKLLASASDDWTVKLWNPATEKEVQKLEGHSDWVRAVAFSPDSKLLASASDDWTVKLWNPITGKKVQKLKGHNDSVRAIAFSPDGKLLASASSDRTVRLWNPATGKELQRLEVDSTVTIVSFSTDGPFLETNIGVLQVEFYTPLASLPRTDTIMEVINRGHWLVRGSENLVWLPPEYRPICSAFQNNVLALGCSSGLVVFILFS